MLPLLALLWLAQAPGAREAATAQELAESLHKRIRAFEERHKAGQPPAERSALVTDAELTAYLNLLTKLPASLIGVEVRFEKERLLARGQLDLDLLQGELGGVSFGPLFSGRMPVTLRGRLSNDDGFGSLALEEARLGAIPLSPSVLAAMVASATRSSERPNGFDILAPFRYPYGLRAVKLSPGRALLEF